MNKSTFLKTKPKDKGFHCSRIMFCIKDGKIKTAPKNLSKSHTEWFKEKGWITNEKDGEQFLEQNIRGFYLPSENSLYCYNGIGFFFDADVISLIRKKLPELKEALNLKDDTKIFFGPKDTLVQRIQYPQHCEGLLKEIIK